MATAPKTSTKNIETLRTESGEAGDLEMVAICDRALDGDDAAWAECDRVIGAAEGAR